ncbi:MAG: conjugal transfer protein TraD [Legionellales bacterium]|nr:conjugal transfer protein TraD [Legionellales bacterium]
MLERKEDTRRKIQLGGLIKKAGLDNEPSAIIFGLLLEAAEILQSPQAEQVRSRWRLKGDLAFHQDKKRETR